MKTRIVSILIICVLMLEGCAVISKNDYTVLSNLGEESETNDSTLNQPGIINLNEEDPEADNDSKNDNASDSVLSAELDVESISDTGAITGNVNENTTGSDENTSGDDTDNGQSGDTGQESNGAGNSGMNVETSGAVDKTEENDKGGKPDSTDKNDTADKNDKTDEKEKNNDKENTAAYIFPKDNSDKSYRKEEDIIIPASQLDKYIADFDRVAPSSVMSFNELVGDNGDYDLPKGFPKPGTYKIIVDLYYQLVMVFAKDENGDYTVPVRYMLCSSGLNSSPTRTGVFKLKSYRVRFGLFNNTSVFAQYWSQIDGRMYFHSILYTERNAESYNTSFNNLGKKSSHGCIRLSVPDARWIWYNAAPGTKVVIRKGSSDDKVTAKIKELLTLDKMPSNRPKSMTGADVPYTDNWTIDAIPHEVDFIQGSQDNS